MEDILVVKGLNKTFKQNLKKNIALNGVDLEVKKGEIYGFLGPNGAGKTTTLKCILGFLKPDGGEIQIFGKKLGDNPQLYKKIGYAPENAYFYDHLKGMEFLIFMGEMCGISKAESMSRGTDLLKKLGLDFAADKFVKNYSKGMKQRLGLAASLINDPEIIFWDEPMSGLDPLGRSLIKTIMLDLKSQGKTIFFNTHILSDVQEIADTFGIIYAGEMLHQASVKSVKKSLETFFIETISARNPNLQVS